MRSSTGFFGLAALLALLVWVTSASAQSPAVPDDGVVLRPGDLVKITVWRNPELSGSFELAVDGSVMHPLYRDLKLTGKPMPEVEQEVRSFLRRFEADPQFVVEPVVSVTVAGQVRAPGMYRLPPTVTVAQAVAQAGGPTELGRVTHVALIRNGERSILNLSQIGADRGDIRVHSGDQILVGRKINVLRDVLTPVSSVATMFFGLWAIARSLLR